MKMTKNTYKSYEELPLMLSVLDVAALFGISRTHAYDLVHTEGFPRLEIGSRIVIPKEDLMKWIEVRTNKTESQA